MKIRALLGASPFRSFGATKVVKFTLAVLLLLALTLLIGEIKRK